MARKTKYDSHELLNGGILFVKKYGIESMCVRNLTAFIGCSTQPIFKNFKNFDEYKNSLKNKMYDDYRNFVNEIINTKHHLLTISYAYALYSNKEKNIFNALFNTCLAGTRSIQEILHEEKNNIVIRNSSTEFNISIADAEKLFINTRFFTHGIATQISSETLKITNEELEKIIHSTITTLIEGVKNERNI